MRSVLGTTILLLLLFVMTVNDPDRDRAQALAEQMHGANYQYFVEKIKETGRPGARRYSATVAAWNDSELKKVTVEWAE